MCRRCCDGVSSPASLWIPKYVEINKWVPLIQRVLGPVPGPSVLAPVPGPVPAPAPAPGQAGTGAGTGSREPVPVLAPETGHREPLHSNRCTGTGTGTGAGTGAGTGTGTGTGGGVLVTPPFCEARASRTHVPVHFGPDEVCAASGRLARPVPHPHRATHRALRRVVPATTARRPPRPTARASCAAFAGRWRPRLGR